MAPAITFEMALARPNDTRNSSAMDSEVVSKRPPVVVARICRSLVTPTMEPVPMVRTVTMVSWVVVEERMLVRCYVRLSRASSYVYYVWNRPGPSDI